MRSGNTGTRSPSPIHTADCGVYRHHGPEDCTCGVDSAAGTICPVQPGLGHNSGPGIEEMRREYAEFSGPETYRAWERAGEMMFPEIAAERRPAHDRHSVDTEIAWFQREAGHGFCEYLPPGLAEQIGGERRPVLH